MKTLNVFAIILAWVLSIAMVVMLVAAPMALSTLSLLEPETIVEVVSKVLVDGAKSAATQPQQEKIVIQNLSATTEEVPEEKPADDAATNGLLQGIQGVVGNDVSEEMLKKVLTSDAMSELLGAYTKDLTNVIVGKEGEKQFTPELLVEVVRENLDEIVEIVEEAGTPLTDEQKQQFKSQLQTSVEDNAEKIVAEVPTPEEVKESLIDGNKELELAFTILAKRNQIKGAIVGAIVLISALIFGLRYPQFRGLRWLSTNLFTAGGINVIICVILGIGSTAVKGAAAGMNAMGGSVDGILAMVVSQLAKGVIVRPVIIFVAAIALLVGYILLKKFVWKKKETIVAPVVAEMIPEAVPAFVPTPVAMETEQIAEPVQEELAENQEPKEV